MIYDRRRSGALRLAAMAGAVLVLAACGFTGDQREAVRQFGQASAEFGDATVVVVQRMPRNLAALNVYTVAMSPGQDDTDFAGPFDADDVAARVRAARTVQNYAGLLLALADPSSGLLVQTEGGKFIASVNALGSDKAMSDGDLDTAGKIIAGIGGVMIDREAADALKQVVPMAHPQIVRIGELFATEFGSAGDIPTHMDAAALKLEKRSTDVLDARSNLADRVVAARGLRLAEVTLAQTQRIYPPIASTASQMVTAHTELVTALQSEGEASIGDIIVFLKGARNLATNTAIHAGR